MAKNKGGRPRKEIDQNQFERLCALHCTVSELSDWFGATDKTLNAWCKRTYGKSFSVVFKEKKSGGNISLRRKQMEVALSGNVSMLIFLGKNYLGQTDRIEETVNTITEEARREVDDFLKAYEEE